MRIAVLSDVHSNWEALKAVWYDLKELRIDAVYFLGDIIGYGPQPRACWETACVMATDMIRGNHEEGLLDLDFAAKYFNGSALTGVQFTDQQLNVAEKAAIARLPYNLVLPELDITLAHGSFSDHWDYIDEADRAREEIPHFQTKLCFVGHTHIPFIFGSEEGLIKDITEDMLLAGEQKFLINVGSVGQPRDGDCRACYAVIEIREGQFYFDLRRVFYDIQKTADAIYKHDLPSWLAERLFSGE
ncbi:metallophosphoesterase family protein [Candidatus Parcubacteria bacterium]|nr:metallophosphoesterase family protein [Candidatus Parcubacteria bacterium]